MEVAHKVSVALAVLWTAGLLVTSSDVPAAGGFTWQENAILVSGGVLALAWLVRLVMVALGRSGTDERRARRAAARLLLCETALSAASIGLVLANLPFRARFALSEPALRACVMGKSDCAHTGLFRIQRFEREDSTTIWLNIDDRRGFAYSVEGAPLEARFGGIHPIWGPWYTWQSEF